MRQYAVRVAQMKAQQEQQAPAALMDEPASTESDFGEIIQNTQRLLSSQTLINQRGNDGLHHALSSAESTQRKRGRSPMAGGEDDEDEYQVDSRVPHSQRMPMNPPPRPSAKRVRMVTPPAAQQASSAYPPVGTPIKREMMSSQAAAETFSSASPAPSTATSAKDFDVEALRERARSLTAQAKGPKTPQSRTAWTRDDTQLLIKAIDLYQCKWSTIQKEIENGNLPFDHKRDQQALRDKARLLKQDLLK